MAKEKKISIEHIKKEKAKKGHSGSKGGSKKMQVKK
jgi:hypothetical protein